MKATKILGIYDFHFMKCFKTLNYYISSTTTKNDYKPPLHYPHSIAKFLIV